MRHESPQAGELGAHFGFGGQVVALQHAALAVATLAINVWAFRIELENVTINARIIEEVMQDVDRRRAASGLNSNDEALREDESHVG